MLVTFFLSDLEKILEGTSGKYCVGDEVGYLLINIFIAFLALHLFRVPTVGLELACDGG